MSALNDPAVPEASDAPVAGRVSAKRKRRLLLRILLTVLVLIGGFLAYVAMLPEDFRVARSTTIAAPPAAVFAQVNDFHNWQEWSPWAKLDPNAAVTFAGPASGVGSVFSWNGNDDVGEGSMTLIESRPHEHIRIDLRFVRPFEDKADVTFTIHPESNQSSVTWTMTGKNNFIGKIFCLIMNMDKMVGGDFEKGLANLKARIEQLPPSQS